MSLFKTLPVGLQGFIRAENNEKFINAFKRLYSMKDQVLYNNSPIFPFAYLNLGRLQLFINEDFGDRVGIIPVVKKFEQRLLDKVSEQKPHYEIHSPACTIWKLQEVIEQLDKVSAKPTTITDLSLKEAEFLLTQFKGDTCTKVTNDVWTKIKTSDDIIQSAENLAKLAGRNYSSLRNTLKHVRDDIKPEIRKLGPDTKEDALQVFREWKEKQGKKYLRVTVGRDLRLIEEYYDKVDFVDLFSYVYYVNSKPAACNFGCRSWKDPAFGIDITVKANIDFKGMGDFAFIHLLTEMHKQGINLINDSGGAGNVKRNKMKFRPIGTIPVYSLVRK